MAEYTWDGEAGVYRDAETGEAVDDDTLAAAVLALITAGTVTLGVLAQELATGDRSPTGFVRDARPTLAAGHLAVGALAVGGTAQLDADAQALIGDRLGREYEYLDGLAADWQQGAASPAQLLARTAMYAAAFWGTWQLARGLTAQRQGRTRERNVLNPGADHCAGCRAETDKGWRRLGTLVPPGGRSCRSQCRCHLEFDAGEAA